MKLLAQVKKREMRNHDLTAAEFCLALGFEPVGNVARWPRRHPSPGVVDVFPRSIVLVPYVGQFDDCAGRGDGVERAHRIADNSALQLGLVGRTGLMTEREIDEHRARRLHRLRDIDSRSY